MLRQVVRQQILAGAVSLEAAMEPDDLNLYPQRVDKDKVREL